MATKRGKQAAVSPGKADARRGPARALSAGALGPRDADEPQRLLREAAWSRMFGRADVKNPFTR